MPDIWKVGIVGGGVMGKGLARLHALSHVPVVVKELTKELAQAARQAICTRIDELVDKGTITWDEGELQKNLIYVTADYDDLKDVNLVIEAVWEKLETKREVFEALDRVLSKDAIVASNTSGSFTISELAAFTSRPDKVIGMHFFNPPTRLPLVEIVRGEKTSQETFDTIFAFVEEVLGKTPICVKDCRGFLVDRVFPMYINEAALALEEMDLDPRAIDAEARNFGWPMGPFVLLDTVVGLDIARDVVNALHTEYGARMKPSRILLYLADQGRFGHKSGAGVYRYDLAREEEYEPIEEILVRLFPKRRGDGTPSEVFERMMLAMINEAARCLGEGIASADDIEIACVAGLAFPPEKGGILHYADELGLPHVLARLKELKKCYGVRFSPAKILQDKVKNGTTFFESW